MGDVSKLLVSRSVKELTFEHGGETWTFKYVMPTWGDQLGAIAASGEYDAEGKYHFDSVRYYVSMLMVMLREVPEGFVVSESTFKVLDPVVGYHLMGIVPRPEISLSAAAKKA